MSGDRRWNLYGTSEAQSGLSCICATEIFASLVSYLCWWSQAESNLVGAPSQSVYRPFPNSFSCIARDSHDAQKEAGTR